MKVYCSECKYFRSEINEEYIGETRVNMPDFKCGHDKNTQESKTSDWYSETITVEYLTYPNEINKDNNCKWYEKSIKVAKKE